MFFFLSSCGDDMNKKYGFDTGFFRALKNISIPEAGHVV